MSEVVTACSYSGPTPDQPIFAPAEVIFDTTGFAGAEQTAGIRASSFPRLMYAPPVILVDEILKFVFDVNVLGFVPALVALTSDQPAV